MAAGSGMPGMVPGMLPGMGVMQGGIPGMSGIGGGPDTLVRLEAFKLTIRAGELSGGRTVTTYESTLKRSLVPDDVAKWNKIYPAYIDKSLKRSEGRRISKVAAAENPTVRAMYRVCEKLGAEAVMDLKHYPRQWWVKGRLLVRIPESFVDLQVGEVGESGERLSGKKNFYRVLARHTPQALAELEAERPKTPQPAAGAVGHALGAGGAAGGAKKQTKAQKALAKREAKKKEKEKGKKGKKKKKKRR